VKSVSLTYTTDKKFCLLFVCYQSIVDFMYFNVDWKRHNWQGAMPAAAKACPSRLAFCKYTCLNIDGTMWVIVYIRFQVISLILFCLLCSFSVKVMLKDLSKLI